MSDPTSSSLSRWLLPALAVFTVLGVLAIGLWSGSDRQSPSALPKPPLAQERPADPAPELKRPTTPPTAKAEASATKAAPVAPVPVIAASGLNGAAAAPAVAARAEDSGPLTDPLPERALSPGEAATARVTVGGRSTPDLSPNQIGAFPRVYLPLGGQAEVQVQLPEAAAGDQVIASVEDGGRFLDGKPVQAFTLDESRQISFQFQASQALGNFRVRVRHGTESKVVVFWAGDRTLAINR